MRILLYTNEVERISMVLSYKEDGSVTKSAPNSDEEYEMFAMLHQKINTAVGPNIKDNPFVEILLKELGDGI